MLSDRWLSVCLSVLYFRNVGVWPNGWMDQNATWYEGIGFGSGHIV